MRFPIIVAGLFTLFTLAACSKQDAVPLDQARAERALHKEEKAAAAATGASAISPTLQGFLADDGAGSKVKIDGKARIAVLYFLDQPANRQAVLDLLAQANAKVAFESRRFGYIDAELEWADLGKLIKKAVAENFDKSLFMRLELDQVQAKKDEQAPSGPPKASPRFPRDNTSFFGPVHSAGYGAGVAVFRRRAAQDLGLASADLLAGQGITVAVYDAGVDLSRTDVFQNRIKDFPVSDERAWNKMEKTAADFTADKHSTAGLEAELADAAVAATLRFAEIKGDNDLNGAGTKKFSFWLAAFQKGGEWLVKMQPAANEPFGDALLDFGRAHELGKPQIINLYTGKYYARTGAAPAKSAAGVKIRKRDDNAVEVALVGEYDGADHGIANLHMVGGDYREGNNKYQGVAPAVSFLAMAPWQSGDYGSRWIPLARSIIQATEAGADVLDLDIFTPGTRNASDLLSSLLCRVTRTTNVVPVVASHNFGPLPGTVQNLAQSPCVLAIGAAHSVGSMREAFRNAVLDPALQHDEDLQTALYSGRGFSQNGLLKPDIISPAYGYTAYGNQMIRFNGTSGATPTTAGMIALLKQAARAKGVELGLPQITMLLQGASKEVNAANARDGFGYGDLDASWTLFQSLYGSKPADQPDPLSPVLLSGQQKLEFEGRPTQNMISLNYVRRAALGSRDEAVPMKFWIEYGGASGKDSGWLKFYDPTAAASTDTLEKDMPSHGNTQTMGFALQLGAAEWAALPPGDHVAVVKGVRTSLYGKSRAVDFAQPITIDKPIELDEAEIGIPPLYGDQYRVLSFATAPGEKLFVSAQTSCGKATPSALVGNRANPFTFVVDNERAYNHATDVMNTYAPMTLSSTPITVTAGRDLTRIAIMRSGMQRCEGPVSGRLVVRRTGFKLGAADVDFVRDGDQIKFAAKAGIQLSAGALKGAEFSRGATYKLKAAKAAWILRRHVKEKSSITVPKGTDFVRIVPDDYDHFSGLLVNVKPDGEVDGQANTDESFLGQFSAAQVNVGGAPVGLEVRAPKAGNQVFYLPAADGEDKLAGTIELSVSNLDVSGLKLAPASADSWGERETKVLTLKGAFPASLGDELKDFAPGQWSAILRVSVEATEEANNSRPGFAEDVGMAIWRGTVDLPVSR